MITLENIGRFKNEYKLAVSQKRDVFDFEGSPVLTAFAKYVIEHFNTILNQVIQSSGGIGRRWEIILKTPWGKVNFTLIS